MSISANSETVSDSGSIGLLNITMNGAFSPTPVEPFTGLNPATAGPVVSLAELAVKVDVPGLVSALLAKSVSWEL